jgi:hypothetical protein
LRGSVLPVRSLFLWAYGGAVARRVSATIEINEDYFDIQIEDTKWAFTPEKFKREYKTS